jgi:hypothetical protein
MTAAGVGRAVGLGWELKGEWDILRSVKGFWSVDGQQRLKFLIRVATFDTGCVTMAWKIAKCPS